MFRITVLLEYTTAPPSSLFYLLSLQRQVHWQQKSQYNTTTTIMFDSRYGVLRLKGLPCSPPNILLVIGAKQLNLCSIWSQSFPPKSFFFVHVISRKLQWSSKVLYLGQGLLSCTSASDVDAQLTVDTGTCLPAVSNSLQNSFLVVFVWLSTILTNFLTAAGDILCYLPDRGSDTTVWIYICSNTDAGTDWQRDI